MTRTEKLLRELIAIPSVNPAFVPPRDPRAGEQRVAQFLAATARTMGLEAEFQKVLPKRENLLIRCVPQGEIRQRVLLAPHLDTVGGDPSSEKLFTPSTTDGRLHGRGACDTKGSVAAMLTALMRIACSPARPRHTEIIFAGLVDEENGQCGSRALAASGFKADLAIVGEPTELKVVTAHKGNLWLRLETRGKAAHGSRPDLGRNAVLAMARIVQLIEIDYAAALRLTHHPVLGQATVNIGSICGGTQPNIVPDRCAIEVDRRTLPGETEASVRHEIQTLLRQHKLSATLEDTKAAPCWPMEADVELPLVKKFLAGVGQKKKCGVDFFCDAAVLAGAGIPSVVFGPGDIAQAHTVDEWVSLRALEGATEILTTFLLSLD